MKRLIEETILMYNVGNQLAIKENYIMRTKVIYRINLKNSYNLTKVIYQIIITKN